MQNRYCIRIIACSIPPPYRRPTCHCLSVVVCGVALITNHKPLDSHDFHVLDDRDDIYPYLSVYHPIVSLFCYSLALWPKSDESELGLFAIIYN